LSDWPRHCIRRNAWGSVRAVRWSLLCHPFDFVKWA
jgi:hypothetical protein